MKKIVYFYIIYSFFALLVNMSHPITPFIFEQLHLNSFIYGASFALLAFSNFITSLFWAKQTQKYGSTHIMILSFIGYAFAQWLFSITKGIFLLMFSRAIAGAFMSGLMVASLSYLLSLNNQVTYLSIYAMIQTVGSALGYFIGGYVSKWGYSMTFYIQIGGCLIAAFLSYLLLDHHQKENHKDQSTLNPILLFYRQLKTAKLSTKVLLANILCSCLGYFMHENWLNYYFTHHYSFTGSDIAYYKLAIAMVSLCANVLLIFFLTKYRLLINYVLLGCCISLFISYFSHSLYSFLVITFVYSFFSVLFIPLQQNLIRLTDIKNNTEQSGLFNSARALGMMLGPIISGMLYPYNDRLSLFISGLSFLLAYLLVLIYFYNEIPKC